MKYFKDYKGYLEEKVNNENSEALNEASSPEKPVASKQKIDIYKPKQGSNKDKHRITNPVTGKKIEISTFLTTLDRINSLANKKNLSTSERELIKSYKDNSKEVKKTKEVATSFVGTIKKDDKAKPTTSKKSEEPASNKTIKKDKSLKKTDTIKSEVFKKESDMPDKEFVEKNKSSINPEPPKHFKLVKSKSLENPKFPKKYIKIIERMVNTNKDANVRFGWSNFSKEKGGAGDISAQGGEILAFMGTSMDDKDANVFYDQLKKHIKEVKDKGHKPTIDESWVTAAENQRKAIINRIKKQYPAGSKIIATSWDTPEEVNALGLNDYSKNKGFSTDIYLKIKTPDGKEILDEVSLKKDKNINFLNSGAGKFKDWDKNLPDDINQNVYKDRQSSRNRTFLNKNKSTIVAFVKKNKVVQDLMKNKGVTLDQVLSGKVGRDANNISYTIIKEMSKSGNSAAKKLELQTNKEHDDFVAKSYEAITKNKKLKEGMISDIRNEFPLKSIAEGEESMAIGDISLDKMTLKHIFGTNDYDKIKDNLTVKTDKKTGKSYLVYEALKGKDYIPIGDVIIYEDGKGYGGMFKFSLKLNSDFAKIIKASTKKIYESIIFSYSQLLNEKINSINENNTQSEVGILRKVETDDDITYYVEFKNMNIPLSSSIEKLLNSKLDKMVDKKFKWNIDIWDHTQKNSSDKYRVTKLIN